MNYDVRAHLSHVRVEDGEYPVRVGDFQFLVNLCGRGKVTAFVTDDGGVKELLYREYLLTEAPDSHAKIAPYFTRFKDGVLGRGIERVLDEALSAMVESGKIVHTPSSRDVRVRGVAEKKR